VTRILDISPPISVHTAVWPGDQPLTRKVALDMATGAHLTLSSLETTVHIGAHADAPSHFIKEGAGIHEVDLEAYIGPCVVVTVLNPLGRLIRPEHCQGAIEAGARRILFRTLSQPDYTKFNTDFVAFSPEAVKAMGEAGVKLIGIDTASVDPFDSKDLRAHQELYRFDIRNIESLDLRHVPDGEYELIALPLKLEGFDASPVRAILRQA
jgi:arylformamidase